MKGEVFILFYCLECTLLLEEMKEIELHQGEGILTRYIVSLIHSQIISKSLKP